MVEHEWDRALEVVVCRPYIPAIQYANSNLSKCLFREHVDVERALRQHDALVRALESHGVRVVHTLDLDIDVVNEKWVNGDAHLGCLANTCFTRDVVLTTVKGCVMGKLAEPVRALETAIASNTYARHGIHVEGFMEGFMEGCMEGCVEGGDFLPLGKGLCMIGCGNRTTMEGIRDLVAQDLIGTDRVAIVKCPPDMRGRLEFVHMDCYLGVAGSGMVLMWEGACDVCVDEYWVHDTRDLSVLLRADIPLYTYLVSNGYTVLRVPTASQKKYGCNVLSLNERDVIVQDRWVYDALRACMINPIYVEFSEFHKMYGGIHCATQVTRRLCVSD